MIKQITFAGTHCFGADAALNELAAVNYIYGPNGSGKTTISECLAADASTDGQNDNKSDTAPKIEWNASPQTVKVYNRNYMRKAFTSINSEEPGVFLLGEDDAITYQKISELTADKNKSDERGDGVQKKLSLHQNELEELRTAVADEVWSKREVIPRLLQEKMTGLRGSKRACLNNVIATFEKYESRGEEDFNALAMQSEVAFSGSTQVRNLYPMIQAMGWDDTVLIGMLRSPIVGGADIPAKELMERLENSDWVHQGMHYVNSENNINYLCPFCQQKLPSLVIDQLSQIFDENYREQIKKISEFSKRVADFIHDVNVYRESFAKSLTDDLENQNVEDVFHALMQALQALEKSIEQKLIRPSSSVSALPLTTEYNNLQTVICKANGVLETNNTILLDKKRQGDILIGKAWREFAFGELGPLLNTYAGRRSQLEPTIRGLENSVEKHRSRSAECEAALKELRVKITSSVATIEAINKFLLLNQFHSFRLSSAEGQKDGYRLIREDGQPADVNSLSEGERTFITFLYYFHSLSGVKQDNESDKIVAVIDDPISSLDSEIMFVISALTRSLVGAVKDGTHQRVDQTIILTHSTRFHNEISYQHKNGTIKTVKYYRIRKYAPQPNVIEDCQSKNPIRTAYQELWDEVRTAQNRPTDQMPWLPNVMRRILESYFTTLGGRTNLYELGDDLGPENLALHQALIAWSHSGSHTIMDEDAFNQHSVPNSRWLEAFERVFKCAVGGAHRGHYEMMMERAQEYANY